MNQFKIEGWFPPCIDNTINGRFACCGPIWIKISEEMTMEDVMKGWICTASIYEPTIVIPKKPTKKQYFKNI